MRHDHARIVLLALLVVAGSGVVFLAQWRGDRFAASRLAWVATARQLGPVGYRDPVGAVSPDGQFVAYSEGRFLRVRPLQGGAVVELPPGSGQIRHLAWHPDSRSVLADGDAVGAGWVRYDRTARTRQPLFAGRQTLRATVRPEGKESEIPVRALRQPAWSPDGRSLAALVNGRDGTELWIVGADGSVATATRLRHAASHPAWTPRGEVACVSVVDGRPRVTVPCDGTPIVPNPDGDVYGPIAFAPDGATVYAGVPNDGGTLDLWALAVPTAASRGR